MKGKIIIISVVWRFTDRYRKESCREYDIYNRSTNGCCVHLKALIKNCYNFFVNQSGKALSDQAVRRMIKKYSKFASIDLHITPHMFRHTFATSLLEADVDIQYIQEMLGHSSINITEIYTHVTVSKQRDILASKHSRKHFNIR